MLVLMSLVYATMHQAFRTELLLACDQDLAALRNAQHAEGTGEAVEVVNQLLAKGSGSSFLVLETEAGKKLAGNLPAMVARPGRQILAFDRGSEGEPRKVIGNGTFIVRGLFAFAGRDLSIAEDTEEDVLHTFGWVLAATLALALAGGVALSNGLLGRMDAISRTCRAIMAGQLADRIPERGTSDEFDRLVTTINAMLDRIADLMANVRQITSDIAHDLRTPLTRLRHHLELARNESASVVDYAQAVERAIADSDNLLSIFSALLRIGQMEGRAERSAFATVDLSRILTDLTDIYRPVAEDSGHALSSQIAASIEVRGDRELLSQLFANLIENAIKHTPPGAAIAIALRATERQAMAEVADSGPGIPVAERDRVFQRFYRLEQARSSSGSGLGLALVRAIADYHDAGVTLSDAEPGLRVTVTFNRTPGGPRAG
jgi:signal transduction histidine kinase